MSGRRIDWIILTVVLLAVSSLSGVAGAVLYTKYANPSNQVRVTSPGETVRIQNLQVDYLVAGKVVLVDNLGNHRGSIFLNPSETRFSLNGPSGETTLTVAASMNSTSMTLDRGREDFAELVVWENSPFLLMSKGKQELTAGFPDSASPVVHLKGGGGDAILGSTLTETTATGEEHRSPTGSLTLFDKRGKVVFQAPR